MATHSSTLAWRIPWTEEPGRLQSMGHKGSDMTGQLTHRYPHINVPVPPQLNLKIPSAMSLTNDCAFKSVCLHQMRVGSLHPNAAATILASFSVSGRMPCAPHRQLSYLCPWPPALWSLLGPHAICQLIFLLSVTFPLLCLFSICSQHAQIFLNNIFCHSTQWLPN